MNKLVKTGGVLVLMAIVIGLYSFKTASKEEPKVAGINFFHGTLKEAKAKAKKENKLIFIDCFTTWCGPCKKMAKTTFLSKEVGDYYNKNFVCMKIDMEAGEGTTVASSYAIEAYPTYLFLDHKGDVKHRDLGFIDANRFIEVGKTALTK